MPVTQYRVRYRLVNDAPDVCRYSQFMHVKVEDAQRWADRLKAVTLQFAEAKVQQRVVGDWTDA